MAIKVPCGGFKLGNGLSLDDDGVTVNSEGGGGLFIITVQNKDIEAEVATIDRTFEEVQEAWENEKVCVVLDRFTILQLERVNYNNYYTFRYIGIDKSDNLGITEVIVSPNGTTYVSRSLGE